MPRERSRSPDSRSRHSSKRDRDSHRDRDGHRDRSDYSDSKRRRYAEDEGTSSRRSEHRERDYSSRSSHRDRDDYHRSRDSRDGRDSRDSRDSRRDRERDTEKPPRSSTSRRDPDSPRSGAEEPKPQPVEPVVSQPVESEQERKQREKRERLEAWKAKKAQQGASKDSPAPAEPAKPATAPASKPAATSAPALKPVKPASTAPASAAQVKAAPAKLSAVSARLGLPIAASNGSGAAPRRAKATNFMGDADEDDESTSKAPVLMEMFKPDAAEDIDMQPETEVKDESDEEDLVGDDLGEDRAAAERRREEMELERAKAADDTDGQPAEGATEAQHREWQTRQAASTSAMDVDDQPEEDVKLEVQPAAAEEPVQAVEEEDEEDPLEAYMNSVTSEVKQINAQDKTKSGAAEAEAVIKSKGVKVSGGDEADDEQQAGPELDEYEKIGLNAQDIMALAAKKLKRRELAAVDHAKISYESFRKAFYHAPPEVEAMSEDDANLLRLSLDGIKIRGVECPKPVTKWSYCGLPASVLDVIKDSGFTGPTPIQTQAIPAIMSGRDVIGVAKTGSGKTVAFLLPMFRHIKDQRPLTSQEGPIAMIMTPTRELATQIHKECRPFLKALGLRACSLYGGSPLKDNIAELKRGVEIVVCTPGRMIELLTTNSGKIISMKRVSYLVLDEADRMFDMGFEPQVTKILNQIRPDRQTVLFSATFPRQMEGLARKILKKPLEITVGGRSTVAKEIEQQVEVREEDSKFKRLLEILGRFTNEDPEGLVLVFVDRQESADDLLKELMKNHYVCQSLHGGKEQVDRDQTIQDFKAGVVPVVIATSVAARGLDVKQLKLVINYDAPNHMEDYVHRAGRTGRAGNKGTCITFITPDQDRYSVDLYRAMEASGATVPADLKEMAEAFLDQVKSGKAHLAGSGFGGKGLDRFDKDREATRKAERSAYGGAGEAGADEEEDKKKKRVAAEDGADEEDADRKVDQTMAAHNMPELNVEIKRGPAPDIHRKGLTLLPGQEREAAIKAAEAVAASNGKPLDARERAKLVAQSLNASLRQKRMEHNLHDDPFRQQATSNASDATAFHAIVYINDYPQKARWKVTNKETISTLVDDIGASVTNRGVFYEKGKDPGYDDPPKLHLLIESNEEHKIKMAIQEIKHILVDAAAASLEAETRSGPGRYTV